MCCLFCFLAEARCRSAEHQLFGKRDLLGCSMEGHDRLSPGMERSESQLSVIELTEVSVC